MTSVGYNILLYQIGKELSNDPNVDIECLVFVCRNKLAEERLEHIDDGLKLLKELDNNGNVSIDDLSFLKEILQELQKHTFVDKIVAFEAKRRCEMQAVQVQRSSVEPSSSPATIMAAERGIGNHIVASPGVALEQRDGGINFVIEI